MTIQQEVAGSGRRRPDLADLVRTMSYEVMPFRGSDKNLTAYLDRLTARPSFARVLKEAEPYFAMFPSEV